MENELHVSFAAISEAFVELPDTYTARLWDIARAVAAGHGTSGILQAEAAHLVKDIRFLLDGSIAEALESAV